MYMQQKKERHKINNKNTEDTFLIKVIKLKKQNDIMKKFVFFSDYSALCVKKQPHTH